MDFHLLFSLAFSFFLLMDPIGNVPVFLAVLKHVDAKKNKKIIIREMVIALIVILFFAVIGNAILNLLNISSYTLSISGGILLFLIALKMVFAGDLWDTKSVSGHPEPFIVPLAIPLVAGPSILAAVMIFAKKENNNVFILVGAILIAWIVSAIILMLSDNLKRLLKENAITALERLMGLILTLIAIQMFLEGYEGFLTRMIVSGGAQ
jgi:MarC family membrane protein